MEEVYWEQYKKLGKELFEKFVKNGTTDKHKETAKEIREVKVKMEILSDLRNKRYRE